MNPQETHNEPDFADDLIKLDEEGDNLDEDMDLMRDLFGGPYKLSGSPTHHDDPDRQAFSCANGGGRDPTTAELMDVETEELSNHSLLQQPLAVGFYVSTAPTGPLPAWFWSACPQRESHCPVSSGLVFSQCASC
jgi:mediator of RNA polymerase II transcription subunit 13